MADNILDFLINEADCDFSAKLSSVTFEETIAKVKEFLMLDLKPCPFCGADAELNFGHVSTSDDVESLAYVICRTCGAKSANHHASSDAQAKKLALHAWNMREGSQ